MFPKTMKGWSARRVSGLAVGGLAGLALLLSFIGWRASRALHRAQEEFRAEREIGFVVRPLLAPAEQDFEAISAPAVFFQAARFQDHLYIAGPAGLLEYDLQGGLVKQYAPGRELPSSPLVAMAPAVLADAHEPELAIATAQEGVLAFNGRGFRQIFPQNPGARAITSVLPVASGHLLIGTKKRGVLLYDGKRITSFHPTLSDLYVTTLAGSESDLWVGTLDRGVLHWHAGETESFSEEQGLPDRQVESIAIAGDTSYVGTVLGVAVFDDNHFARALAPGVLASAVLPANGQLFVGSEDQGVIAIPLEGQHPNSGSGPATEPATQLATQLPEVRQLFASGRDIFALTRDGLYRMGARGLGWQQVLQPGTAILQDRNVSALAADDHGRLWVGYFDRGLDLLEPDRGRAVHVENEHVFCVNRILPDDKTGTVDVATANGLVRFDAADSQEQVLTRADGLIADHVTDVVPYEDGLAVATPAGLTFLNSGGARSMYAFHGLVNNHVYALGVSGDQLLAGTLGGLSLLEKGDVQANYTTASSGLKHNWITAVARVGEEWMLGTYGAGIMGLDPAGHIYSLANATGRFEVNPNAMLVTPTHVFAGTLGKGLYVHERASGRWFSVEAGLPSSNVTALAVHHGYLYIGTDNGLVRVAEEKLHP
jgi:ligand-binding sensor domain-containing protein